MEDCLQGAPGIGKAPPCALPLTEDESISTVRPIAKGIRAVSTGQMAASAGDSATPAMDKKKAIKEASITCLECGNSFKMITRKHLATHGLTYEEYKAKYGYKKTQALACKSLSRGRRAKMTDMKLWERRTKAKTE